VSNIRTTVILHWKHWKFSRGGHTPLFPVQREKEGVGV